MSTAKKRIARIIKSESGQGVLIAVLILLVIGGLMFPPLLGFMSAGLKTGQMHEEKAQEVYAADSGVELGMWKLQEGEMTLPATLPTYNLNNCDVVVTITSENATEAQQLAFAFDLSKGGSVYKIVSTAKFINSSSEGNTTIEAHVVRKSGPPQVDDDGSYNGTGDIGNNAIVNVTGNLTMDDSDIGNNAEIYVAGNATVNGTIKNNAIVCVGGDLTVGKAIGNQAEVYVGGNITENGEPYAGGAPFEDCPWKGCPLSEKYMDLVVWESISP